MRMMVIAGALMLGACANLVQSTPAGGILKVTGNKYGTALQIAQTECSKYSKDARISGQNVWNNTVTYDCVERGTTK